MRIIAGLGYWDDFAHAFKCLDILTMPYVYIFQSLVYIKNDLPRFGKKSDNHDHNTRSGLDLRVPYCRLERSQRGPNYNAVKFYNRVPTTVRLLPINSYKCRIRKFLSIHAFYTFKRVF